MAGYPPYNPYAGYAPAYGQMQPAMQAQQMMYAQPQQAQQPTILSRLVTSREEAMTAQIAFDGTINVFYCPAADEVYIKRFNPNTGGAIFDTYQSPAKAQQSAPAVQPEYAPMSALTALEQRVDELTEAINAAQTKRARGAKTDE